MDVVVKCSEKFRPIYNLPEDTRIVVLIGGRGGGKTYEASKNIAFNATVNNKRVVVLRDEKEQIRESILSEIKQRYDTANKDGVLDQRFECQSTGIKDKTTGEMVVFTKGFRASDLQKKANLKGVSDVDIAVIEEAEDIRDVQKFNIFSDSLRKKGSYIIIILNTPDIRHWIIKRYFNIELVEDGYYKIVPKKLKGFVCIQSNYTDNEYLPEAIVEQYASYGDPKSVNYDKHYYLTAILGYASTGRKGQIIRSVQPISLADYMKLPFKEYYGQDFGTASPAALVGVKFDKGKRYVRQINYKPMSVVELAKLYHTLRFGNSDKIVADCAEPETINKLKHGIKREELTDADCLNYPSILTGFYVVPCSKSGGLKSRITLMTSGITYFVEESTDLWTEAANWCYSQDKFGNYTDDPVDDFNHLLDAWGYVEVDQRGKKHLEMWG